MPERIAINTGPLIALTKAQAAAIIGRLPMDFLCPPQVEGELAAGALLGLLDVRPPWLKVVPLNAPLPALALTALDAGEAAVIQLALEQGIEWVCMDDRKGRRAAMSVGLGVTGTLGLLVRAKTLALIPAVRPFTDRLASEGYWFHPELVRRVLEQVGE